MKHRIVEHRNMHDEPFYTVERRIFLSWYVVCQYPHLKQAETALKGIQTPPKVVYEAN